jgi:hypothetical protein
MKNTNTAVFLTVQIMTDVQKHEEGFNGTGQRSGDRTMKLVSSCTLKEIRFKPVLSKCNNMALKL